MNKHAVTKFAAMGGLFEVTVVGQKLELFSSAQDYISTLENLWSRFESDSDISRLNAAEGKPVLVSDQTCLLIKLMIESHMKTNGIYDPTILPLLIEIGYDESKTGSGKKTSIPASATWPGNLKDIEIEHGIVKLPKGTTLDSGGIGKGLAADLLSQFLMESGAEGALVSASGDVVAHGESIDGNSWKIGIEDPFNPGTEFEKIQINDGAVATSSSMKNTFGDHNHHLISTATGKSSSVNIATASVVAKTGANAEVLTKIAFHYEPQQAIELIEKLNGSALIVEKNGEITRSQNWSKFVA
jgi:thiamine biosynthesis lipoprotein